MMRSNIGWLSTLHVAQMEGLTRRMVALLCRDGWLTPAQKVRGIWFIDPLYSIVMPQFYLHPGERDKQGERPEYDQGKPYKYKRRKIPVPWSLKMQPRRRNIRMVQKILMQEEQRIIQKEQGA